MLLIKEEKGGHKPSFLAFGAERTDDGIKTHTILVQGPYRPGRASVLLYQDENDKHPARVTVRLPRLDAGAHQDIIFEVP